MIASDIILVSLISISATVAVMLGAAWHDLGRPLHARTWSIAFVLATCIWILTLATNFGRLGAPLTTALMPALGGLCSSTIAMGFRQRAGLPDRRWTFLALTAVFAAILLATVLHSPSRAAWIAPMSAWNASIFALSARTLRGRRQGERLAERVAEAGLVVLALLHFLVLGGMIEGEAGLLTLQLDRLGALTLLVLPTIVGAIGLFSIILLTADLADQTRRLAATDMLTGLLNRRGFDDAARAVFTAARRHRRPMALVMIDADRFKEINDRFGHSSGDRVLRSIADRIGQGIGRRDIFARVGGEEFALILIDVDLQAAACAVEVLRLQVETMAVDLPEHHRVTASFGIAAADAANEDLAGLLHRADQALYRSKQDGRNRVTVSQPAVSA